MTQLTTLDTARRIRRERWQNIGSSIAIFLGFMTMLVAAFMAGHSMALQTLIGACQ